MRFLRAWEHGLVGPGTPSTSLEASSLALRIQPGREWLPLAALSFLDLLLALTSKGMPSLLQVRFCWSFVRSSLDFLKPFPGLFTSPEILPCLSESDSQVSPLGGWVVPFTIPIQMTNDETRPPTLKIRLSLLEIKANQKKQKPIIAYYYSESSRQSLTTNSVVYFF